MIPTAARKPSWILFLIGLLALIATGCTSPSEPQTLPYGGDSSNDGSEETSDDNEPVTGTAVGQEAPDFSLVDLSGTTMTLSDYRGQPVLLYFWATYCSYCAQQNPSIQAYYEQYGENLQVLTVDLGDTVPAIQSYMTSNELDFPVLLGTSSWQTLYHVYSVPNAVVLDAEGIVQFNDHPGYLSDTLLLQLMATPE